MATNFIKKCIKGTATIEDIYDYIDKWHNGNSTLPLYEYLGMTKAEYTVWMPHPHMLPFILENYKEENK